MAEVRAWDLVMERFRDLGRYQRLYPLSAAMLALVAQLPADPRLADVEPDVSMASLTFRLPDSTRQVDVGWVEGERQAFKVSFVDPPLQFHDTHRASEDQVVSIVVDYINQLRTERPA